MKISATIEIGLERDEFRSIHRCNGDELLTSILEREMIVSDLYMPLVVVNSIIK